jgi:hypothetical protein
MRPGAWLAALACAAAMMRPGGLARAEYRAYELEVIDVYDCAVNKRERCRSAAVRTGLAPDLYQRTHGGEQRISVLLLATWMCRGDTSNYEPVCPRPAPRDGKFGPGDQVRVKLARHISNGWIGVVEVAYYQQSVRSNVYGVRFADRQDAYLRYYEKDLEKTTAASGAQAAAPGPGGAPAPGAVPAPPAGQREPAGARAPAPRPSVTPAVPPVAGGAPPQSEPPQ